MTVEQGNAATGAVRLWLRLEGLAVLAAAVYAYHWGGHSWMLFAALFLVPDIGLLGYLAGPRAGAVAYNVLHSYLLPVGLAAVFHGAERPLVVPLIWAAHIGFDRLLGYGLKYPGSFHHTHLGSIGRR